MSLGFTMPRAGRARVVVLDVGGRLVATLADAELEAGRQTVRWNLADTFSKRVRPGLYFARIVTPEGVTTVRIAVTE